MREARARFSSSMRSTFSSTVPAVTSLCAWTARVWPILYVRSVAWSSTAGFHQRSKWNTWVVAVIEAGSSRPRGEDEGLRDAPVLLEASDHGVPGRSARAAVEKQDVRLQDLAQVGHQALPYPAELREDERPVA